MKQKALFNSFKGFLMKKKTHIFWEGDSSTLITFFFLKPFIYLIQLKTLLYLLKNLFPF